MLRNHGMERDPARFVATDALEDGRIKPWFHEQQALGFNYRMTDLQAALGFSQLAKLDGFLHRRREIAARYDAAFAALPHLRLPQTKPEERARSALHLYLAVFDLEALGTTRTAFMARLNKAGVGSQVHYIPVYRHPYYAQRYGVDPALFPAAESYYRGCLSLPVFPGMTDEDVEHVVATVREAVGAA
jgi:dTDP-4-amino-4,6-dideoxygalactose transaminase